MADDDARALSRRAIVSLTGCGVLASAARAAAAEAPQDAGAPAAISGRFDQPANPSGRDLDDPAFIQSGEGAAWRTARAKAREFVSVKDFGATGDGGTDDTDAFVAAASAHTGKIIHVPPGVYRLGRIGNLNAAGTSYRGGGRFASIIKPLDSMGTGDAIFSNESALAGSSAFGLIEDIGFDLGGQNCVAIDLSSCNNFNVNRCHFSGGRDRRSAAGIGVRFGSPRNSGAYTNAVTSCSGHALAKGVEYAAGANSCAIIGGEFLNCLVGADAAPAGYLDTARIIGTRFEGCDVSVKLRAVGAQLHALRFEDSRIADVQFMKGSSRCEIMGGYSATTRITLMEPENCDNLVCIAGDLGWFETHDGAKYMQGSHVFSGVGQAVSPPLPSGVSATAFFTQMAVLFNDITLESVNSSNDGTLVVLRGNASNELEILGYDRKARAYRDVNIGGGTSVNPITTGVTSLGKDSRRFKTANLSEAVLVDGKQVIGRQRAAISDATDAASAVTQVNAILACLRAHGLIAP